MSEGRPGRGTEGDERSLRMTVRPDETPVDTAPTVGSMAMSPPITCPAATTVQQAASSMAERKIGALVIEGEEPGIITERDILFAVADRALDEPVTSYASDHPVTIDGGASVIEATRIMAERGVRHLLVTEGNRVVGVFTARDLIANQVVRDERG